MSCKVPGCAPQGGGMFFAAAALAAYSPAAPSPASVPQAAAPNLAPLLMAAKTVVVKLPS